MLAAFACGLGEQVAFSFLPIFAVGANVSAETGALWLSAFVIGNIVLQWPIGWAADELDRRSVLAVCALTSAALVASIGLGVSLLLAVMADRVIRGATTYKAFLVWPYAVAPAVAGVLWGIKPAVTALVLHAAQRIGTRALKNRWMWGIAAASFVAIFAFDTPFPAIVLAAALIGHLGARRWPQVFALGGGHGSAQASLLRLGLDGALSLLGRSGEILWATPPLGGAYLGQGRSMTSAGIPWGTTVPGPGRSVHASTATSGTQRITWWARCPEEAAASSPRGSPSSWCPRR